MNGDYSKLTGILASLLVESLYKRIGLTTAHKIIPLTQWSKDAGMSASSAANKAKRGTVPAFRLRGAWMIPADAQPVQ